MRHLVQSALLVSAVAFGLFVLPACSDDKGSPPVTQSAEPTTATVHESPAATPSPTVARPTHAAPPPDAYRDAPATGRPDINAVIGAVRGGDPQVLLRLFRTQDQPCSAEEFITFPACAPGEAAGTPVPSVFSFQCEAGWVPIAAFEARPDALRLSEFYFYGATIGGPPSSLTRAPVGEPVDYWILFKTTRPNVPIWLALGVARGGVVSFGRNCGENGYPDRYVAPSAGWLVAPRPM